MAKLGSNPRALAGIAGLLAVFVASLLASTAVDAAIVVPVAVVAAFASGLLIMPNPNAEAEREAERRLLGEHLDRQVRSGRKLSILDPQTAMLQRWYFELRVAEEARRCRRYGTSMAVMFVKVQDASQPDKVWTQEDEMDFVQMFGRTLRSVDLAARIHEREYAICLPHTTEEGADTAASRLLKNSGAYTVHAFMAFCPRDGIDYESLVDRAEPYTPKATRAREPGALSPNLQLVKLIGSTPAGEIAVPEGQTVRSTKAKMRRASKRAGVDIRIWDENGMIHFERQEAMRQEGAA
ncbi:MAG TPA: diguanylate cyclase [Dehalococcoidia bacterium]|jgi:GGDEF domain-containing protein|nr:diguanylate cyclase [Dehalococcoidia bacterium]